MANMKQVNKAIKKAYPDLDIEAVRGGGYVYFCGEDGFDVVESIMAPPVSTDTEDMIRMVLSEIDGHI